MKRSPDWVFMADQVSILKYPSTEVVKSLLADFRAYAANNKGARLAIDLETTGLDPYTGQITLVGFSWSGRVVTLVEPDAIPLNEWNAVMADEALTKVFHNGKFDMKWMMHHFRSEFANCDDTMIMRQLLTCGIDSKKASLKAVTFEYLNHEMAKEEREGFISETRVADGQVHLKIAPITDSMLMYAALDVAATWALQPILRREIDEAQLTECYGFIERDLVQVVADMELTGIGVDLEYAKTLQDKLEEKLGRFQGELDNLLIQLNCMPTERRVLKKGELIEMGIPKFTGRELPDPLKVGKTYKEINPEYQRDHIVEEEVDSFNVNSSTQAPGVLNAVGFSVKNAAKETLEAPNYTQASLREARVRFGKPELTDRETLAIGYDVIELLRNIRSARKQLTAFVIPLQTLGEPWRPKKKGEKSAFLHPVTGRIHGEFKQIGTETGRFSHSNPNLAQMPAPKEAGDKWDIYDGLSFRRLFIACANPVKQNSMVLHLFKGKPTKTVFFDYQACELRILAEITKDAGLILAMQSDDPHRANAAYALQIEPMEVTKDQRKKFKITVFCKVYGGGYRKIAGILNISFEEAKSLVEKLDTAFQGMNRWGKQQQRHAIEHGYVLSMGGRKRFFEVPEQPKYDPVKNGQGFDYNKAVKEYKGTISSIQRKAVNTPIQATNADVTKLAMVWLYPKLKPYNAHLLVTVHDELGVECPEEHAEVVYNIMEETMLAAEREFLDKVPAVVDGKIATFWDK